jgi:sugar phosphate isomerase/epimerase
VRLCESTGIQGISLWRDKVAETGLCDAVQIVRDAGVAVTSLCRGGMFSSPTWMEDNREAIDEAAALGAEVLVLVTGGLPTGSRDLPGARAHVAACLEDLVEVASGSGVRLGVEPLHPMFCSDRSVISTLQQALELVHELPAESIGVVVDSYHVWWDPTLFESLSAAAGRIVGFHINDWIVPLPEGALLGRGIPGEGCIDLASMAAAVFATGYDGPVEVEVLNEAVWDADPLLTVNTLIAQSTPLLAGDSDLRDQEGPRPGPHDGQLANRHSTTIGDSQA